MLRLHSEDETDFGGYCSICCDEHNKCIVLACDSKSKLYAVVGCLRVVIGLYILSSYSVCILYA